MTPEETFHQLLGLGQSWKVVRTEFEEKEQTFVICVEETAELWPGESQRCGQTVICYDHVEPMQWRHLNVFNKECVIVCALPRGRRKGDGAVYRVTPPWEGRSKHFTKEFEAFALTLAREMPIKKAGEILGETDQRMWRMLHAHIAAARQRADWSEVVWVERHLKGILAHWKEGLTTAFLEGLNSLFSATKRKARGYRTTKNLLAMLYFVAGKLQIPCY